MARGGTREKGSTMAHQSPRSRHPLIWALITILILAPLVGTLWVPFYARTTPKVADFPFFYWYQLMWVPIVAVTTALAYALTRATRPRQDRAPRASAGGPGGTSGPAGTGGPGGQRSRAQQPGTHRPGAPEPGQGTV